MMVRPCLSEPYGGEVGGFGEDRLGLAFIAFMRKKVLVPFYSTRDRDCRIAMLLALL